MALSNLDPVVALDMDGVLRIPSVESSREFRTAVMTAQITMRRPTFPSYTHTEPPWDETDTWTGVHTFSEAGVQWVRELAAAGITMVWTSSWGAYANAYFGAALGIPELPFMDAAAVPTPDAARWLVRQYPGRPMLWVNASASAEAAATFRARQLTRLHIPDRAFGLTVADLNAMDHWLEMASGSAGQDELRRRRRRAKRSQRARRRREMWGSEARYRRRQSARTRLLPLLGPSSTLLTLLADYTLEIETDVDLRYIAKLREQWGRADDPPAEVLGAVLAHRRTASPGEIVGWAGQGYPPELRALMRRGGLVTLDVGRGWWPLLIALDEQLALLDADYVVARIRSSNGQLDFRAVPSETGLHTDRVDQLVRAAQTKASRTCERCGRRGTWRRDATAVLCDEHARPLTDDEIAYAIAGGVPAEVFTAGGAIEASLFGTPRLR